MQQVNKKKPIRPYKKADFVRTGALGRYMKEKGFSKKEIAEFCHVQEKSISNWVHRNKVPKQILDRLGIKARNVRSEGFKSKTEKKDGQVKLGDSLYACYVGQQHISAFEAFCSSLGISAKFML